jgi:hypothetical protein
VHILTAGLTGWALAMTWQKKRFLQLFLAYCCAVAIHGLWNGLTLLYSFNLLSGMQGSTWFSSVVHSVGSSAPFALVLLAIGCFCGLVLSNRFLRSASSANEPAAAPPEGDETIHESVL